MSTRAFFPQGLLDILIDTGKVDLDGDELIIKNEPYRYRAQEGIRVLREVTTGEDPHDLCGKVTTRMRLTDERGAELLGGSLLLEDNAYDVVPGFIGEPVGDIDPGIESGKTEEAILVALQNIEDE